MIAAVPPPAIVAQSLQEVNNKSLRFAGDPWRVRDTRCISLGGKFYTCKFTMYYGQQRQTWIYHTCSIKPNLDLHCSKAYRA